MGYEPEALQELVDHGLMAGRIDGFLAGWAGQVLLGRPGPRPAWEQASITEVPFLFCLQRGRMQVEIDDGTGLRAQEVQAPALLAYASGSWVAAQENRAGVAYLRLTCADEYTLLGAIDYREDHQQGTPQRMDIATITGGACVRLAELAARFDGNPADRDQLAAASAIGRLLLIDCARALRDGCGAQRDPRLERVLASIHGRWQDPPGRAELAALVGLSPGRLSRAFSAAMGVGLARYCLDLRLDRARRLLRITATPVAQVAGRCGFGRASYFSRCYRERFGCRPQTERGRQ